LHDKRIAEIGCFHTGPVDSGVVSAGAGISLFSQGSTLEEEVAAAAWFGEIHRRCFGHAGWDGLEAVGVVDGELRIERRLLQAVDAAVGDADAVPDDVPASVAELHLGLEIFYVDGSIKPSGLQSQMGGWFGWRVKEMD
jgi:hypothetical protein